MPAAEHQDVRGCQAVGDLPQDGVAAFALLGEVDGQRGDGGQE